MKAKKLTAILLALTAVSFCGCGDPFAKALIKDGEGLETLAPSAHSTNEPETETATAELSEASERETAAEPSESEPEDTLAEVQRIAREFEQSAYDMDYAAMVDSYAVELLYYMENGRLGSRDEYIALLEKTYESQSQIQQNEQTKTAFEGEPVHMPEKAGEYMDVLRQMNDLGNEYAFTDAFNIDDVYIYRVQAGSDTNGAAGDGMQINLGPNDVSVGMDIAVIHINGQWKVDTTIPVMQTALQLSSSILGN